MDLKKEIALLERKLELLKLIKQAQDELNVTYPVYIPYPVYPPEPVYLFRPWYEKTTAGVTFEAADGTQFSWTN